MIRKILTKIAADTNGNVGFNLIVLFIPVAFISYLFHEFGHWLVGELLGNRMTYSLNGVSPVSGHYINSGQAIPVIMGGPVFTILLSFIFLLIIEKFKTIYAYPFVLFQVFSRFFSLVFGGFTLQDEAKASAITGAGSYTVAIVVLVVLFAFAWRGSYVLKLNFKTNWYLITVCVFCELLVIATDKLI